MELINKNEAIDKVLELQRKLYRWSEEKTEKFDRLYNLTYNPYVLSQAWYMLKNNNGSRTAGVDGVKLKMVFLQEWKYYWFSGQVHRHHRAQACGE